MVACPLEVLPTEVAIALDLDLKYAVTETATYTEAIIAICSQTIGGVGRPACRPYTNMRLHGCSDGTCQ